MKPPPPTPEPNQARRYIERAVMGTVEVHRLASYQNLVQKWREHVRNIYKNFCKFEKNRFFEHSDSRNFEFNLRFAFVVVFSLPDQINGLKTKKTFWPVKEKSEFLVTHQASPATSFPAIANKWTVNAWQTGEIFVKQIWFLVCWTHSRKWDVMDGRWCCLCSRTWINQNCLLATELNGVERVILWAISKSTAHTCVNVSRHGCYPVWSDVRIA